MQANSTLVVENSGATGLRARHSQPSAAIADREHEDRSLDRRCSGVIPPARPPHPYNPPCLALTPGSRIGPYQLAARIGVGGMGEVYQARDTTLNRQVAIKVLLPAVANDPDRLARFRREAQVLASLNHPHIAQIHGFEDADGVRALVMELVEGPTLADRIASGAIAMAEALAIASQIADALEAAHEQGVTH